MKRLLLTAAALAAVGAPLAAQAQDWHRDRQERREDVQDYRQNARRAARAASSTV